MSRNDTAATVDHRRETTDEQTGEAQDETSAQGDVDVSGRTNPEDVTTIPNGEASNTYEVSLVGERIEVGPGTTVRELRETEELRPKAVITHWSGDGITALTDDDVIVGHVTDSAEIHTQPLAHTEVPGTR